MSNFDPYDPDVPVQYAVNLDIPRFVREAVRKKIKRPEVLMYLYLVSITDEATDRMRRFFPVSQENNLSRNEILIWMHIAYGDSVNPRHISRKLRIPIRWVEKAITVLEEKNIIHGK